jgi:hypothetical protein
MFKHFVTSERPCLLESEMFTFVNRHIHLLMRRNGTSYELDDSNDKSVLGTLYGSRFFEKNQLNNTWGINMERAISWENAMLDRIQSRRPWESRTVSNMYTNASASYAPINMNFLNSTAIHDT